MDKRKIAILCIVILVCIGIWQLVTLPGKIPAYLLPSPIQVAINLYRNFPVLLAHTLDTGLEACSGLVIGILTGAGLASIMFRWKYVREALMPLIVMLYSFPKIAVAPLLVVWVGLGLQPKILLSALLSFFPVVVNMLSGLLEVDRNLLDLVRIMSAREGQIFLKIRLPGALSNLVDAVRIAVPLAIIGAVVGEFVGGNRGLGYLVLTAGSVLNTPLQFSALIMMGILSLLLFALITLIEKRLIKACYIVRNESRKNHIR